MTLSLIYCLVRLARHIIQVFMEVIEPGDSEFWTIDRSPPGGLRKGILKEDSGKK